LLLFGKYGKIKSLHMRGGEKMAVKSSSKKVTSPKVATKAAKALSSKRTSSTTKTLAGSALSQAAGKKR